MYFPDIDSMPKSIYSIQTSRRDEGYTLPVIKKEPTMTQKATITQVKDAEWSSKRVYHQTGNVKRDTKPAPKPAPKPEPTPKPAPKPEPTPKPAPLTAPVTKEGEKMPSWIWIAVIGGILLVILLAIKKRK